MSARRVDYLDDPNAPAPNSVVPSANVIVVNEDVGVLVIRRTDNGNYALPGGGMDLGDPVAHEARPRDEYPLDGHGHSVQMRLPARSRVPSPRVIFRAGITPATTAPITASASA